MWRDVDQSSAVIAEIIAGPVVWGGVGWLVDRWLGTDPWLLAIGAMGGFVGGLYLVWLRLNRLRAAHGTPPHTRGTDDEMEGDDVPTATRATGARATRAPEPRARRKRAE